MSRQVAPLSRGKRRLARVIRNTPLYLMMLPGLAFFLIYRYVPMYGVVMAFQNFRLARGFFGSAWVGFANFEKFFTSAFFPMVMENTLVISIGKLLCGFPVPVILELMLNEVRCRPYKRTIQTVLYMPHFVSWVIVGSIINVFLLPGSGLIPQLMSTFGMKANWLIEPQAFRWVLILSEIWKTAGWGTIVYMAALSGINTEMYEAALIDGANKRQQIMFITLPCIWPTILTMFILRIGGIMSAGFEQILVLQNDMVYSVSEIIDTYVYNRGFLKSDYGFGSAVGLFKSVIGMALVVFFNWLSRKTGEGRIW